jgi:hypothetical protein
VDEALAVLDMYNLDFNGSPALHYLLANAAGASAVVEFVDGRTVVTRDARALTNFRVAGSTPAQFDRRYTTIQAALAGPVYWRRSLEVLRAVAQAHTQWSVTYEPRSGAVHLVARQNRESVHDFTLTMDS